MGYNKIPLTTSVTQPPFGPKEPADDYSRWKNDRVAAILYSFIRNWEIMIKPII